MADTDGLVERCKGHTPGPWAVNPFCAQVDSQIVSAKGGLLPVAQLLWPSEERSEAETEANAALIAEAPALLSRITFLEAQLAEAKGALEFIADLPDPGEERERSATFYRIHAANLKQIAAKAIGRQIVSQEALNWAEEWANSEEGQATMRAILSTEGRVG